MKFCTWHDSCAVVACANFFSDIIPSNEVTLKPNFHQIRITMEKSSWNGHQVTKPWSRLPNCHGMVILKETAWWCKKSYSPVEISCNSDHLGPWYNSHSGHRKTKKNQSLKINLYWFEEWLDAMVSIWQQGLTWTNADQYLCRIISSLVSLALSKCDDRAEIVGSYVLKIVRITLCCCKFSLCYRWVLQRENRILNVLTYASQVS